MSKFNLRKMIKDWNQKELVKFSLFCCGKVKHLMDEESLELVELVEKWLEDEKSVSNEELRKAANAAHAAYAAYNIDAAYAAAYAAHAATYPAYCAAYNAARAAYNAARAAYYAANAFNISDEVLYLDYMRDILSNIMES